MSSVIRVVVLTRGHSLEAWEVNALRLIKELPYAEIVLEVRDATRHEHKTFTQKLARYRYSRLFWNRWFKRAGKVNATSTVSTAEVFHGVPHIETIPERKGKFSEYFTPETIDRIKSYAPDVIIRFGFNILRGDILEIATHGVWSFHHADHQKIRGGPAGFWEYILRHHSCGAILQRLTAKLDDGIVLRTGHFPLVKHSFRENLDLLLANTSAWIANALTELHLKGKIEPQHIGVTGNSKAPVFQYPGNFRMLQFWMILWANKFSFHWKNLFQPETWKIGVIDQPIADVIENGIRSKPKWIAAERSDEYLADPFSINFNGKDIILAELYSYREQKGRIINTENFETFAAGTHHASFPYPINVEGRQYILPEIADAQHCSLYDIRQSESSIMLVHEPLVDPVLIKHNDMWWLFAHHLNYQNNSALFIYYSSEITSKFQPHPLNPVKTDIRNSRSAGPIMNISGRLLRPAQDSSVTYGHNVVINEITELTTTSFREFEYKRICPDPSWDYSSGVHTLSPRGPGQTMIDAKSFRFNFANFKAQFRRKSRRITGK